MAATRAQITLEQLVGLDRHCVTRLAIMLGAHREDLERDFSSTVLCCLVQE